MNELLENIRTSLKNHYRDIEIHESFVTAEKVRNAFLGFTAKQRTLLELFKKHNEDAQSWLVSVKQLLLWRSMTDVIGEWKSL